MAEIHVCSLRLVDALADDVRPSHVLSLLGGITPFPPTPAGIAAKNHLKMTLADISEPQDGMIAPGADHVLEVIEFGRRWARDGGKQPLLVHCFAGISRSTASALAIACALRPATAESVFARAIREASATAQPNRLIVAHADELLGRDGRLIDAVEEMGLADLGSHGKPFSLKLGDQT